MQKIIKVLLIEKRVLCSTSASKLMLYRHNCHNNVELTINY